jgi:hypothetical protein
MSKPAGINIKYSTAAGEVYYEISHREYKLYKEDK